MHKNAYCRIAKIASFCVPRQSFLRKMQIVCGVWTPSTPIFRMCGFSKKHHILPFSISPPKNFQVVANQTILIVRGQHMAHLVGPSPLRIQLIQNRIAKNERFLGTFLRENALSRPNRPLLTP